MTTFLFNIMSILAPQCDYAALATMSTPWLEEGCLKEVQRLVLSEQKLKRQVRTEAKNVAAFQQLDIFAQERKI